MPELVDNADVDINVLDAMAKSENNPGVENDNSTGDENGKP